MACILEPTSAPLPPRRTPSRCVTADTERERALVDPRNRTRLTLLAEISGGVAMSLLLTLFMFGALTAAAVVGALAHDAPQESQERVCQARADELKMTAEMRDTYMRECLAGERLERNKTETK